MNETVEKIAAPLAMMMVGANFTLVLWGYMEFRRVPWINLIVAIGCLTAVMVVQYFS